MRARLRFVCFFFAWLAPATIAIELAGCNDGSTGCCMICPECACGDSCISCTLRCTQPKGCACGNMPTLRASAVESRGVDRGVDLISAPVDAGERE